ncbi:hypothetical protein LXL04_039887 [Taraxacum kok-saghyz]
MQYQPDDKITLWVNKVGPYNNPQETYNFYSLPFCHLPGHAAHKWGGLGEVLGGNELIDSQMDVKFQKNVEKTSVCKLELDEPKVMQFKQAIENNYWFELFMDDLPLWGFVGELHDRNTDNKHMLFTHMNITLQYNKDQVSKPNEFHDFAEYFVLKAIAHVVALVRAADRKSPREAVDFILQLLKVNVSSTIHFHSIYITT